MAFRHAGRRLQLRLGIARPDDLIDLLGELRPAAGFGCDEWGNRSVYVVVPCLSVTWFFDPLFSRSGWALQSCSAHDGVTSWHLYDERGGLAVVTDPGAGRLLRDLWDHLAGHTPVLSDEWVRANAERFETHEQWTADLDGP